MSERPVWCSCDQAGCIWYMCDCPHHATEIDIDAIPTRLYSCRVCHAVLPDGFGEVELHVEWHAKRGDLS